MPTVWHVVPSFEFLIECWETMSTNLQYVGLKDALKNGIKSLHKWHGRTDGTAAAYFICLGKFLLSSLILLCWANFSPKVLDPNFKDMYFRHEWDNKWYSAGMKQLEVVVSTSFSQSHASSADNYGSV
jgi:hypothetical protein